MRDTFTHVRGTVQKNNSRYLQTLKDRTNDPSHPRHHGVAMQAHHAISAKGVSLTSHGDRLEALGYDINDAENLVFIPYTLQGACLLQIQPHRGNHTAVDPLDDDSKREPAYHDRVMQMINAAMPKLERACGSGGGDVKEKIQDAMNKLSAKLVRDIQHNPKKAMLTQLYANFQPGEKRGCGGVDSVRVPKEKVLTQCPVHRNHYRNQGAGRASENITFQLDKPYELRPGK